MIRVRMDLFVKKQEYKNLKKLNKSCKRVDFFGIVWYNEIKLI